MSNEREFDVVIFGATGFIGQSLSYELSKLGCKLIINTLNEINNNVD